MGLEKLAWIVVSIILFLALLALPVVQSFLSATYVLIETFNAQFFPMMPAWFGWFIVGFIIALLLFMINQKS